MPQLAQRDASSFSAEPASDVEPGLRVSIGIPRSGKTHGIRSGVFRAAAAGVPVLVLDQNGEWTSAPASLRTVVAGVRSVERAARAVESGARLVVVRTDDVERDAAAACEWAAGYAGVAGVACPEGHAVLPSGRKRLPKPIERAVTAWAHERVSLWVDSQSLWQLHRTVSSNAALLRCYAMVSDKDLAQAADLGGRELAERIRECTAKLARGEAGWHVRLGLLRLPPYTITREV
jgi:hypothetical protein